MDRDLAVLARKLKITQALLEHLLFQHREAVLAAILEKRLQAGAIVLRADRDEEPGGGK